MSNPPGAISIDARRSRFSWCQMGVRNSTEVANELTGLILTLHKSTHS
jgi:hypothetical protein